MTDIRRQARWIAAFVVGLAALSGLAPAAGAAKATETLQIKVLSNRADLISGGDALVEVVLPPGADPRAVCLDVDGRDVRLTNLDKVFWPEEKITKGGLIQYYADVAPVLLPHIRDRALDRRRRGHGRAGEMGARAGTLPADEVAVGRRDAALARRHALAVGGDTHRAAGFAPFEARVLEDAVEPLGLGLALHAL